MEAIDGTYPLAVIAPHVGAASETFIRRHMCELLPGRTVVVTGTTRGRYGGKWAIDCPCLELGRVRPSIYRRVAGAILRRAGMSDDIGQALARRFLRKHNVRVVLSEWLDRSEPWFDSLRGAGIRFFAHAHGYDVSRRWLAEPKWGQAYLKYNKSAGVITMSECSRQRLIALGLHPDRVHVVPYGVDVPEEPLARPARREVRCVAVGRMVGKKAPIILLDAFRRAAERMPDLHLDYLGGDELLPAARQYVRALGLSERVWMPGAVDSATVLKSMRNADIFLQHSVTDPDSGDEEGLPVAILEAMAMGLPVVSTRHAGIPEAVLEAQTGFLVDEWDHLGMSDRLVDLALDSSLRLRMGRAGWERAKERFSWERERSELLRIMGLEPCGALLGAGK